MGWSDLPSDLLILIAKNLQNHTDHLRFRSVCSHWRSSFPAYYSLQSLPPQLPWLALPCTRFYSLSEDRIYSNRPRGVPKNTQFYGSASGWLLSLCGQNHRRITSSLINPFTGALIKMPAPLSYLPSDTLIWDRSDSVVLAACNTRRGMFYCRLGEAVWAPIESQQHIMASDINFYEGRFYIHHNTDETVVLDGETLELITLIGADFNAILHAKTHLLVSSGDLLLLVTSTSNTTDFYKVQRLNPHDEGMQWVEINDIGDRALFVDNLHCFSVEVGDKSLLRRNCIYSAHSMRSGRPRNLSTHYSISVFDLGTGSYEQLDGALRKFRATSSRGAASLPSWILPSLS